jgi:hypothetical protein
VHLRADDADAESARELRTVARRRKLEQDLFLGGVSPVFTTSDLAPESTTSPSTTPRPSSAGRRQSARARHAAGGRNPATCAARKKAAAILIISTE